MPTVLPFHRAVLDDPAFAAADGDFGVHTRWIETEFSDRDRPVRRAGAEAAPEPVEKSTVVVEVNGKRLEVVVPAGLGAAQRRRRPGPAGQARTPAAGRRSGQGARPATP